MAKDGKVHPDCPSSANPYHECFEECYVKMGKPKPQRVKSFSGLVTNRRKNRESSHQTQKPDKDTTSPYDSAVEADHTSGILSEKYELDNSKTINSVPYSRELHLEDFSFNKGQAMSSLSRRLPDRVPKMLNGDLNDTVTDLEILLPPPDRGSKMMNGNFATAVSTPSRYEHNEEKHVYPQKLLPGAEVNEPLQRAEHTPVRSTSSSIMGNCRPYLHSNVDEVQSVMSESQATVGKYYVKESLASILRAILDKYGDIAENCALESVSMRSYSLECVCVVIQDLQSNTFMQLTKAKIQEMLSILKDLENSRIRVDWLCRVLNELSEVTNVITQHQHCMAEKLRHKSGVEVLKKELETQLKDLAAKEQDVQEAKARVTETRDLILHREIESSKLREDATALKSQLESFRFTSLIEDLLR